MSWAAVQNGISQEIIALYISAIFWTLGYDTIYGTQDISDDEIIGIKSTAIKFKNNIKKFVTLSYLITITLLTYLLLDDLWLNISTFFILLFFLSLIYQIVKFKKDRPDTCLQAFKFNNYSGVLLFLGIILKSI